MSNNQGPHLSDIPVGGEVDREVLFAADSPRDLTHVEVLAIAVMEAWADEHGRNIQSWEATGGVADTDSEEMATLISRAVNYVNYSEPLAVHSVRSRLLEAAQLIREGSVRGDS